MSLANLNVRVGADIKEFQAMASKMEKALAPVRQRLQSIGAKLSLGLTAPILALGTKGVQAWDKQAKAIAKVENAIKSTGGTAGRSLKQLQTLASDLQSKTLFGDEEILEGATAQLLTFTNIAGNQFERTQAVALDLATMLGGDLKSASIQLGKALNAPLQNLSALSRSGIQFSDEQRNLIRSLTETGRLAEAQNVILGELERQYGGTAAAAAAAGTGPLTQLRNTLGDITEEMGAIVFEGIRPLIGAFSEVASRFTNLSEGTKRIIVGVGAVAAAIGPLLISLGGILKVVPLISAGFTVLTGPFGLIAAAASALAAGAVVLYRNWDKVREQFDGPLSGAVERFKDVFTAVKTAAMDIFGSITQIASAFSSELLAVWDAIVDASKAIWDRWGSTITTIFQVSLGYVLDLVNTYLSVVADIFGAIADLVTGDWEGLWNRLQNIAGTVGRFIARHVLTMADLVLAGVEKMFSWIPGVENLVARARSFVQELRDDFAEPIVLGPVQSSGSSTAIKQSPLQSFQEKSPTDPVVDPKVVEKAQRIQGILAELPGTIKAAVNEARLFGGPLDAVQARANAIKSTITDLLREGLDPSDARVAALADQFRGAEVQAAAMTNAIGISEIMREAGEQIALARMEAQALGEEMSLPGREAQILEETIRRLVASDDGFGSNTAAIEAYRIELENARHAAQALENQLRIKDAMDQYAESMTLASAKLQLYGDNSEFARSKVQALQTQIESLIASGVDPLSEQLQGLFEDLQGAERLAETEQAINSFSEAIQAGFSDAATGMLEGIGRMLAGTESAGGIVTGLLSTFADLAVRVGKIAVGVGLGVEGIKKALAPPFPGPVAIAAGAALIALGTAAKASLSKAASGGGGQSVGGSSSGFGERSVFENANASTRPANRAGSLDQSAGQDELQVRVVMESNVLPSGDVAYSFRQGSRRLARQGTDIR